MLERRDRLGSSETSWKKSHHDFLETLVRAITGCIVERNRHFKVPGSQNAVREALSRHAEILSLESGKDGRTDGAYRAASVHLEVLSFRVVVSPYGSTQEAASVRYMPCLQRRDVSGF